MEKTTVTCVYDAIIPSGCSYSFEHTVPHRVINMPSAVTSTLILQSPSRKAYSDVFIELPLEQENRVIPKFTCDELVENLQRYMLLLEERD